MANAENTSKADAATGASIVALRRGAILMVERARPPFRGLWSFPGGRAHKDEEPEATARRELLEETGLAVGPLVRLGAFNPNPKPPPFLLTVFAARAGDGTPRAGDDAARAEFVPLHAVLERRCTPDAAGWITRAIAALSGLSQP